MSAITLRLGEEDVAVTVAAAGDGSFRVVVGGETLAVAARACLDGTLVLELPDGRRLNALVTRLGRQRWVTLAGQTRVFVEPDPGRAGEDTTGAIEAPMPGRVLEVSVAVGEEVLAGQRLMVVEAMKMEHALTAPRDGVVASIAAAVGDMVSPGTPLVVVEDG